MVRALHAGSSRSATRPFMRGCVVGAAVASVGVTVLLARAVNAPRDLLPLNTATGYLVFRSHPHPPLPQRHFALDMRRGVLRRLDEDYRTMSEDGSWVVLEDGTCRGPGGKTVSLTVTKRPDKDPEALTLVQQAAVGNSGILVCCYADRVNVVDITSGHRMSLTLEAQVDTLSLSPDGRQALVALAGPGHPRYRLDLVTGAVEPAAQELPGAVSASGTRAYKGFGRCIMLERPDGAREKSAGPGVWLGGLVWSPDERFIAYSYPARTEAALLPMIQYWMAVGILELETRRHYRPPPVASGGAALDMVGGYRWVSAVPEWLMAEEKP